MATESRAREIHERSIVIDGLNVSRWGEEAVYRHLHEGGLTAINATVAVWEGTHGTLRNIARFYKDFDTYSRYIRQVTCLDDIRKAKEEGRVGVIFGFQNSSPIEDDLDLVEVFHRLGVRAIQITYNDLNLVGAGCYERRDVGLSQFGVDLVAEMNRLGMVVDLSHVGHRTTMDAIETSDDPVWFSHTNPRTLCDHPRNKTDEEVKALVATGGIVGANSFPTFLARGYDSTLEDVLDVVDYWVDLVGIDSVGIGLDFTELHTAEWFHWLMAGKLKGSTVFPLPYPIPLPDGITRADEMPNLTAGLAGRGYSGEDVQKIMGLNVYRLFERVWKE
ncbi:MAG: dipeptidase [Acidobacteriota bacterium]|nr:dipeptidase [Acidobacteriota bacterium]